MARSRTRKHRPPQQHHDPAKSPIKKRKAVIVAIIFLGLLGFGIGWFAAGYNIPVLALGVLIGAVCGYFFGRQIESSFAKK